MIVSPSLLAANFANLQHDIEMINASDADMLHLDIMDGVFVPNISFGFPVLKAVGKLCTKPLDVHLMIVNPSKFVTQVSDIGATLMNVHQEACIHLDRTVSEIKEAGMKAAVTLNPATPVSTLVDIIDQLDMVLLMSVNPGFGGQKFIPNTLKKIARLKELIETSGSHALIEIDGGVNAETAPLLSQAGADILVAGSYVFNSPNPTERIKSLKNIPGSNSHTLFS
ncbi:MAG: ribulose-phosphate 3-epimerase [Clostridiales bacterium]|nr:ribulose-phosphate 3-epimerase [Clostridiales bacterium]